MRYNVQMKVCHRCRQKLWWDVTNYEGCDSCRMAKRRLRVFHWLVQKNGTNHIKRQNCCCWVSTMVLNKDCHKPLMISTIFLMTSLQYSFSEGWPIIFPYPFSLFCQHQKIAHHTRHVCKALCRLNNIPQSTSYATHNSLQVSITSPHCSETPNWPQVANS